MRSSGRMLQSEMGQDMIPGAFDASFPADHSVEAAEVPTPPTQVPFTLEDGRPPQRLQDAQSTDEAPGRSGSRTARIRPAKDITPSGDGRPINKMHSICIYSYTYAGFSRKVVVGRERLSLRKSPLAHAHSDFGCCCLFLFQLRFRGFVSAE